MASIPGRYGRRRRLMNEEVISASSAHRAMTAGASDNDSPHDSPRYSEAAGIENHPQITDFLPRRFRSIGLLAIVGLAATTAVEALHFFSEPLIAKYGGYAVGALRADAIGGIAAWLSAVLLMLSAVTCLIIYSLRRHRINDYRGRYRVWLAAGIACGLVSLDSVAPLHRFVSAALFYHTGWTALRDGSVWWLVVGGLPLTWIALRSWFDARESRLAATALGGAISCYTFGMLSYVMAWPTNDPRSELMLVAGATLLGHWLLLVGVVSYGRFVVLDAQGLVTVRIRNQRKSRPRATVDKTNQDSTVIPSVSTRRSESPASQPTSSSPSTGSIRAFRQGLKDVAQATPPADSSRWISGTQPSEAEEDDSDDEPDSRDRKLSKADRKRLRKLKAQNRAA